MTRTLLRGSFMLAALAMLVGFSPHVSANSSTDQAIFTDAVSVDSDGIMTQIAADGGFVNDVNFINSSTTMLGSMQDTQIFVASNTFNAGASANFMDVNSNNQAAVRNQVLGVTTASAWNSSATLSSDLNYAELGVVDQVTNTAANPNIDASTQMPEVNCRDVMLVPVMSATTQTTATSIMGAADDQTSFTDKTWALGHVKFSFTA